MRKISFFAVLFLFLLAAKPAFSHPASQINVTVDGETVNLTIAHDVLDPAKHFIKEIDITLNGKEIIEQNEIRQVDKNTQLAIYKIPGLVKGDVLTIKTECNRIGEKTITHIVQ